MAKKVYINADLDWIAGFLRYGHREGYIEIPDKDLNEFKENPIKYIEDNDLIYDLELVIDDYRVEECGEINHLNYNINGEVEGSAERYN